MREQAAAAAAEAEELANSFAKATPLQVLDVGGAKPYTCLKQRCS